MQLSQTFYDQLEECGWESDEFNGCDVLIAENDFDIHCEIWPVEEASDTLEFVFDTYEKQGKFQFYIEHQRQDDFIINRIIQFYNAESYAPLIEALLQNPNIHISALKFSQERRSGEVSMHKQHVSTDNLLTLSVPVFEPIDSIDCYLAGKIRSSLTLPKAHFDAAFQRLLHSEQYSQELMRRAGNLPTFIKTFFFRDATFDAEGNITDLPFGGDIWDFHLLEFLKDLFLPNSYIILQDDGNIYWKVVVNPERVEYFRERL